MALTEIDHLIDEMADCTDTCLEAAQACEWCADSNYSADLAEVCAGGMREVC